MSALMQCIQSRCIGIKNVVAKHCEMFKVVIVCAMMHVRSIIRYPGLSVSYLGASKVAAQTTPVSLQPSRPVAERKAQGVHTCML